MPYDFVYKPDGATLGRFHASPAFFRGIMGHVGSGKSVACAIEVMLLAMRQEPGRDGIRRSRCAVIRNTTPQLKTTTLKTWQEWFPENVFGRIRWDPPITHVLRFGDVECEVIFLALDSEKDIRKLLSLELTFAWVNEAREVSKAILDAVTQRVGRYPSARSGVTATHPCVIADTNPPGPHHWWPIMSGDVAPPDYLSAEDVAMMVRPEGWEFFTQPPAMLPIRDGAGDITGYAMNPARENARYLDDAYYQRMIPGKGKDWIAVYILNRYADLFEGQPVYTDFNEIIHVAREPLLYMPGHTLYVGMDFGLTPAATFAQRPRGRWLVQRELVSMNSGMSKFADRFKRFLGEHYPNVTDIVITGDPAGDQRAQTDEETVFNVLHASGVMARKASTNDPGVRIDMVAGALSRLVDGKPGYLVSPKCPMLIAAKKGGYHYAKGHKDKPEKNDYSHVSDAEQYMMDGAGEASRIVHGSGPPKRPSRATANFSPFKTRPFSPGGGLRRL